MPRASARKTVKRHLTGPAEFIPSGETEMLLPPRGIRMTSEGRDSLFGRESLASPSAEFILIKAEGIGVISARRVRRT